MSVLSRLGALAAVSALTVGGLAAATPTANAANAPSDAAANWLVGQLSGGLMPSPYGGSDFGLSIDTGFSLAQIGGHDATVSSIADGVQGSNGTSYIQYAYDFDSDGDGTTEHYVGQAANATAKALAFLQSLPTKRSTIGSVNLVQRMESLTADSGPTAGRIADNETKDGTPDGNDYASPIGQAFAARGLAAAGSTEAPAALSFLLQQQCGNGGFREDFSAPTSATQGCATGDASDVDTTAIAVLELLPQSGNPTVATAISRARSWLTSTQQADGSWASGLGTNGNSTGLATNALGSGSSAQRGAQWLQAHQASAATPALANDAGAIAYNDADYAAGQSQGITSAKRDTWRRVTAQAAPGLLALPVPATAPAPAAPSAVVRLAHNPIHKGHRERVVVRNLRPRELAVIKFRGSRVRKAHANRFGVLRASFRPRKVGTFAVSSFGFRSHRSGAVALRVVR